MIEFLTQFDVAINHAEATANTTTLTGAIIDMAGFDSLVLLTTIGTANSGNYIYIEHGDVATLTDAADVENSKMVAANSGEVVALEIQKPILRYIRPYIVRGASTTAGTLLALRSKGRKQPVDYEVASQIKGEIHVSPISGTK